MSFPNRVWRRWHRWFGLITAIPLLVLASTGLLLNHLDDLQLRQRPLPLVLAKFYGVPEPEAVLGSQTNTGGWWLWADDSLYFQQHLVAPCKAPFAGVAKVGPLHVAGCGRDLLLLSDSGDLLERLGRDYGVPTFSALGTSDGGLLLQTQTGVRQFDVDSLTLDDWAGGWQPLVPVKAPDALAKQIPRQLVPEELNWERLLLDVHAGRVLPWLGTLIMDISALLMLALAGSGLLIWWRTR